MQISVQIINMFLLTHLKKIFRMNFPEYFSLDKPQDNSVLYYCKYLINNGTLWMSKLFNPTTVKLAQEKMSYLHSDEDLLQMAGNIFHLSNLFFQFAHVFMDLLLQNT